MGSIHELLKDVPIPRLAPVRQIFTLPTLRMWRPRRAASWRVRPWFPPLSRACRWRSPLVAAESISWPW